MTEIPTITPEEEKEFPLEEGPVTLKRFGQNNINNFCSCDACYREKPRGISVAAYSRLHVGLTSRGIQIWCARHDINVLHLDFGGATIHGQSTTDEEDRGAMLARAPVLEAKLEATPPGEVLRSGLTVLEHRLATTGLRSQAENEDQAKHGTSSGELLRAFSAELDYYLMSGEMRPEWQAVHQMMKAAKGQGLILPPGA